MNHQTFLLCGIMETAKATLIAVLVSCACHTVAHVCDVHFSQTYGGLFVDCSRRHLNMVPQELPPSTVALDLSGNHLTTLANNTFSNLPNLTYLNLNANSLKKIGLEAFKNLYRMTVLHMSGNDLSDTNDSLPYGLFRDLTNLHTLNMQNIHVDSYPDWLFPPLKNLRKIYLDSLIIPVFGRGFSYLTNLKLLQFDSRYLEPTRYCAIQKLQNKTFLSLQDTGVKTVILQRCPRLTDVELSTFDPLTSLTTLVLTENSIGVKRSLEILKPFVGRNMTKIDLSSVFPHLMFTYSTAFNSLITTEDTKYLTHICLREFVFSENQVILIQENSFFGGCFKNCIEIVDLSVNRLLGDIKLMFQLSNFTSLKRLSVGNQKVQSLPVNFSTEKQCPFGKNRKITMTLPESLIFLDITGFIGTQASVNEISVDFRNSENLKVMLVGYNSINNDVSFSGLSTVETLDLTGNYLNSITNVFLKNFGNLSQLSVADCSLGFSKEPEMIFYYLNKLRYLDISRNFLTVCPLLPNPSEIEQLNLSRNAFFDIPINIRMYTNISSLDLSYNSISYISKHIRNVLDEMFQVKNLSLRLNGNTVSCGCETLDFILWLVETPVIYESDRNYACIMDDGSRTTAARVAQDIARISRKCNGKLSLILTVTFGTLVFIFVVATYVIIKNPTRYQNTIMRILGLGVHIYSAEDFHFTLYVGYCENDIPFVYQNLRPELEQGRTRLFLKDRQVLPGCDIADGIVEGINNSWKTLLVVSHDFLADPWSNFTINTAVYAMTDQIPDRILILLMEDVLVRDLPDTLLNSVDEDFILQVEDYEDELVSLWTCVKQTGNL